MSACRTLSWCVLVCHTLPMTTTAAPATVNLTDVTPAAGTRFVITYPSGKSSTWVVTAVKRTAATGGHVFVFYTPEFAYTDGGRNRALASGRLSEWLRDHA